jgi:hypothetical protein
VFCNSAPSALNRHGMDQNAAALVPGKGAQALHCSGAAQVLYKGQGSMQSPARYFHHKQ